MIWGWCIPLNHLKREKDSFLPVSAVLLMQTRERLIRLEEAITREGDLIEKMLHQMDMRFEQTNRRIDDMNRLMDMRIEQVNRRIDELTLQMNIRFEQMEDRIERVDKRISRMFTVLTTISSIIGAAVVLAQFIG